MTTPPTSLSRAVTLLDAGQPAKALPLLRTHLAGHPSDPEGLAFFAQASLDVGDIDGATRSARASLALSPENEHVLRILALALAYAGNHADAVKAAEEARRLHPDEWRTHLVRSQVDIHGRKATRDGEAALEALMRLAPDLADTHVAAAMYVRLKSGGLIVEADRRLALVHARRALQLDPQDQSAQVTLAVVELSNRYRPARGARLMLNAISNDPANPANRAYLFVSVYELVKLIPWQLLLLSLLSGMALLPSGEGEESAARAYIFLSALVAAGAVLILFVYLFHPVLLLRSRAIRLLRAVPRVSFVLTAWLTAIALCFIVFLILPFIPPTVAAFAVPAATCLLVVTGVAAGIVRLAVG